MKISTQINGIKVQSAKNSAYMFFGRTKLTNIDFSMLNTANVTNMREMFRSCSGLTSLDLTFGESAGAMIITPFLDYADPVEFDTSRSYRSRSYCNIAGNNCFYFALIC